MRAICAIRCRTDFVAVPTWESRKRPMRWALEFDAERVRATTNAHLRRTIHVGTTIRAGIPNYLRQQTVTANQPRRPFLKPHAEPTPTQQKCAKPRIRPVHRLIFDRLILLISLWKKFVRAAPATAALFRRRRRAGRRAHRRRKWRPGSPAPIDRTAPDNSAWQ